MPESHVKLGKIQKRVLKILWRDGVFASVTELFERIVNNEYFYDAGRRYYRGVCRAVQTLKRRGLVYADRDPFDDRVLNVSLTDEGEKVARALTEGEIPS